ncbi:MAG: hypothetical protein IJZ29_01945 [Clostridia bacterium]|nr:hypothetical protein [Clostridia bacterium]
MKKLTKCLACFALVACCIFGFAGCTTGGDLKASYYEAENKALRNHMKGDIYGEFKNQTFESKMENVTTYPVEYVYKEKATDTETVTKFKDDVDKMTSTTKYQRYGNELNTVIKYTQYNKYESTTYEVDGDTQLLEKVTSVEEDTTVYMFGKVVNGTTTEYYVTRSYSEKIDGVENTDAKVQEYKKYADEVAFTTAIIALVEESYSTYIENFSMSSVGNELIMIMINSMATYVEENGAIKLVVNQASNSADYEQDNENPSFLVSGQKTNMEIVIKDNKFSSMESKSTYDSYNVVDKVTSNSEMNAKYTVKYSCDKLTMTAPTTDYVENVDLQDSDILSNGYMMM